MSISRCCQREVAVLLGRRKRRELLAIGTRQARCAIDPIREPPGGGDHRELRIDVGLPRHAHEREQRIAELGEHPGVRLSLLGQPPRGQRVAQPGDPVVIKVDPVANR
ncbi:MAG: hypothetical protein ACE5EV_08155, partial [Gaiellales bacterium]